MSLLSHISAFEYWRLVGTPGFPMPQSVRSTAAPIAFDDSDFEWLAGMGLLSLPLHGLTSKKYKNRPGTTYRHNAVTQLPRGSLCSISRSQFITSPELTLLQISQYLSFAELAGIVCEFCGLYTINEAHESGIVRREPLTSVAKIAALCDKSSGMAGVLATKRAARYAFDGSRSPMETAAALLLTLPQQCGGYSLRGAELNRRIPLGVKARKIAKIETLEPDVLWPHHKIVVEYDSDAFHSEDAHITNDARRKNAFLSSGFQVITLTAKQLFSTSEMDKVASQIGACMKKRLRRTNEDLFRMKQQELRFDLLNDKSVIRRQYFLSQRLNQSLGNPVRNMTWADVDESA